MVGGKGLGSGLGSDCGDRVRLGFRYIGFWVVVNVRKGKLGHSIFMHDTEFCVFTM